MNRRACARACVRAEPTLFRLFSSVADPLFIAIDLTQDITEAIGMLVRKSGLSCSGFEMCLTFEVDHSASFLLQKSTARPFRSFGLEVGGCSVGGCAVICCASRDVQ